MVEIKSIRVTINLLLCVCVMIKVDTDQFVSVQFSLATNLDQATNASRQSGLETNDSFELEHFDQYFLLIL